MKRSAVVVLSLGASVARADVATWIWTVSDTGNGDGIIEPSESALLTLSVAFDPPQPQDGGMFAAAGPYDILGDATWAGGMIDTYDARLDQFSEDPMIDAQNNIRQVWHFQLPAIFGGVDHDASNPIDLFFIRWTPGSYAPATVTLDNGGPDAWIYTDMGGNALLYAGEGGAFSFDVVPAPATGAIFALCIGGCAARRRR
jgi:hypothetical protein